MIIRDIIEHQLELFDEDKWNFYVFYKGYALATLYLKYEKGIAIDLLKNNERNKLLEDYYWASLIKSIQTTKRKEDESSKEFEKRLRRTYFSFRRESFEKLQKFYLEDYRLISKFFSVPKIKRQDIQRTAFNDKIWMVETE